MNKKLNLVQVFIVTKAFLETILFKEISDGLDIVHASFIINKCKNRWEEEPETWDPSVWIDWMKAANQVLSPEIADPATTRVTALQGYEIMKKYIQNFAYEFEFQDLITLFKTLDIDQQLNFMTTMYGKTWQLCVDATLENKLTLDGALLALESMILQQHAFEIMQLFLQNYFSKLPAYVQPKWLIDLQRITFKQAQASVLCQEWFAVYQTFLMKKQTIEITILEAYNVMHIFLEKCKTFTDDAYLVSFFEDLKVRPDNIPLKYESLYAWIQAAYKVVIHLD